MLAKVDELVKLLLPDQAGKTLKMEAGPASLLQHSLVMELRHLVAMSV